MLRQAQHERWWRLSCSSYFMHVPKPFVVSVSNHDWLNRPTLQQARTVKPCTVSCVNWLAIKSKVKTSSRHFKRNWGTRTK